MAHNFTDGNLIHTPFALCFNSIRKLKKKKKTKKKRRNIDLLYSWFVSLLNEDSKFWLSVHNEKVIDHISYK